MYMWTHLATLLLLLLFSSSCMLLVGSKWAPRRRRRGSLKRARFQAHAMGSSTRDPTSHSDPRGMAGGAAVRWVYDRTRRRGFGRRRRRDCMHQHQTEDEAFILSAALKWKPKKLHSFRSKRSIRKQKYVARKCRRRTRCIRTTTSSQSVRSRELFTSFATLRNSPDLRRCVSSSLASVLLVTIFLLLLNVPGASSGPLTTAKNPPVPIAYVSIRCPFNADSSSFYEGISNAESATFTPHLCPYDSSLHHAELSPITRCSVSSLMTPVLVQSAHNTSLTPPSIDELFPISALVETFIIPYDATIFPPFIQSCESVSPHQKSILLAQRASFALFVVFPIHMCSFSHIISSKYRDAHRSSTSTIFFLFVMFTLSTQSTSARIVPSDTSILGKSSYDLNDGHHVWAFFSFFTTMSFSLRIVLIPIVIASLVVLAMQRSIRVSMPNRLFADMVDPESLRNKTWLGSPNKKKHKIKKIKMNAKDREEARLHHIAHQSDYEKNKRQRRISECEKHASASKQKVDARIDEEAGLPAATRDVKHFSESMREECDMETCRARLYINYVHICAFVCSMRRPTFFLTTI